MVATPDPALGMQGPEVMLKPLRSTTLCQIVKAREGQAEELQRERVIKYVPTERPRV